MKENSFTSGPILSPLIRFAIPVLLALLLQAMYGAVDLLVVGKFAETADISAVATGTQIMHVITGLFIGLASGLTVLLGQKIGEGDTRSAGCVVGSGIVLFAIIGAVCTLLLVGLTNPICTAMQAPQEAFTATASYVRICSAGSLFIIAFNVLGSIFRGLGDSKMPLITVAIACVVNIFGDLFLVAVFHMGAAGAALATVFAQAISVAISLVVISRRSLPFDFRRTDIRLNKKAALDTLRLGVPIALQDILVSFSFLVIMAIVNSIGMIASAGVGVAEKICAFVMLLPSACSQAMSAFVAQNIGAEKPERAKKALLYGILASLAVSVVIFYVAFFHGDMLCGIFANERDVIAAGADYLKAYAIDCLLTSFLFCFVGYFSGLGKSVFVMVQGIAGAFGVRVPVSFLVSRSASPTLFHIGLATPASTIVQILLCFGYLFLLKKREKAKA